MCKVKNDLPLLSIRLMVFNHADFLEECLKSINEQKTNFRFELVIGDDFSEDNSLQIIRNFNFTNSNIQINVLPREKGDSYYIKRKKFGRLHNFRDIIDNCNGTYIALLDGDDYWTDPLKLQKQVDFLESSPAYNYCGHKSSSLVNGKINEIDISTNELTFSNLFFKNALNTATLVFRASSINKLPDYFEKVPAGDWVLQLIAIKDSKAFILQDNMSVYRVHEEGIWSLLDREEQIERGVKTQEFFKKIYNDKESIKLINKAIKSRRNTARIHKPALRQKIIKLLKKIYK